MGWGMWLVKGRLVLLLAILFSLFNKPLFAQEEVKKLHAQLTSSVKDKAEHPRAFFEWLAENVAYETGIFSGKQLSQADLSAQGVIRLKRTVCHGYSNTFKALCDLSQIPCFVVSGYSRGWGPSQKINSQEEDHAWVAFKVNDQWFLSDPTWGAGYLDNQLRFVKKKELKFFKSEPSEFIKDHLPIAPQFQLLEKAITFKAFESGTFQSLTEISYSSAIDSLNLWTSLPNVEAEIRIAREGIKHNPNNTFRLGSLLLNKGADVQKEGYKKLGVPAKPITREMYPTIAAFEIEALLIQREAIQLLSKSKALNAPNFLNVARRNLQNSEKMLQQMGYKVP